MTIIRRITVDKTCSHFSGELQMLEYVFSGEVLGWHKPSDYLLEKIKRQETVPFSKASRIRELKRAKNTTKDYWT